MPPGRKPKPRRTGLVRAGVAGLAGMVMVIGVMVVWLAIEVRRAPVADLAADIAVSRSVLDRHGVLLRAFQTPDDRWRLAVGVEDVDPLYLRILTAYEDRRFADHGGVDPRAILRAAVQAALHGRIVSGGSTLTMQVARLMSEKPTRRLTAKWRQIIWALALERRFTKQEILELYLLRAPFGGNIEGIRAATYAWFGKPPQRLTPAEAALLVALPQSPEGRRPDRYPDAARAARDRVLATMKRQGVLSSDEVRSAMREAIPQKRRPVPRLAPHATRKALLDVPRGDETRLTLDAALQSRLERLASIHAGRLGPKTSIAILVADHTTGEVLARVGSPGLLETERRGHVDMTRAVRSPGSTLKPLIYGMAFEEGVAHPDSLIDDRPSIVAGYSPTNFDLAFQGTVQVRDALAASLNVPAVALLDAVGVSRLRARFERARIRLHLPDRARPGLALALGGVGVTLEDLVALYGALANKGTVVRLRETMTTLKNAHASGETRILSSLAAWRVGEILSDIPPPPAARGEGIAYKTGTSYGYRDAWAIGYDGRHVVGVWSGRADGTPISGRTGFLTAAPILFDAFQRIGPDRRRLPGPPAMARVAGQDVVPEPLRHARTRARTHRLDEDRAGPEIVYPPDGAVIDLGLSTASTGDGLPLVVKLRRGRAPYIWLANGRPIHTGPFDRSLVLPADGPGTSEIAVIDADGRSARIEIHLR